MELELPRSVNSAMTFDEVSMERSKGFVNALQELKNLRPQLHSAAEYCEKSYLHSEQKEMVLENLKDYAVRALVNAVDHLGTVAYKLTDLVEQQNLDVSTIDLRISTLNQQLLTCQIYTDNEGLRQQQLLALIPRHHKHYILPNSVNKKVHFSPHMQVNARKSPFQTRARIRSSGIPAAKTLSWHLASETNSTLKGSSRSSKRGDPKFSVKTSGVFQLLDNEESNLRRSTAAQSHSPIGVPTSSPAQQTLGVTRKDALEGMKPLTTFKSFDNKNRREIVPIQTQTHTRSKSMLAAFFVKQKTQKLRTGSVS